MRGKCYKCGECGHRFKDCERGQNHRARSYQGYGRGNGRGSQRRRYDRGSQHRGYGRGSQRGSYRRDYYGDSASAVATMSSQQGEYNGNEAVFLARTADPAIKVTCNNNIINNCNEINWILDSGCTDHIVNNDQYYDEFVTLKKPIDVKLGDGKVLTATKVGKIRTVFRAYNVNSNVTITNVYFVKDMRQNLISYSRVTNNNKIISKGDISKIFDKNRNLIALAKKINNLYYMNSYTENAINKEIVTNLAKNEKMTEKEKWHRCLGHINFQYLNKITRDGLVQGIPKDLGNEFIKCAICIESKMSNLLFKNKRTRAKEVLEIIQTDLNGPHPTTGNNGEKYFLTFIDNLANVPKSTVSIQNLTLINIL